MRAIKLFCCHLDCGPGTTATWGYWVEPLPDSISYACDRHLGEMLPSDASSHHETATRINVWHLVDGYDPTACSAEEIEAARSRPVCACGAAPDPREPAGAGTFIEDGIPQFVCGQCWTRAALAAEVQP